jgi:hypothetical protein
MERFFVLFEFLKMIPIVVSLSISWMSFGLMEMHSSCLVTSWLKYSLDQLKRGFSDQFLKKFPIHEDIQRDIRDDVLEGV